MKPVTKRIESLRQKGFQIKIYHRRDFYCPWEAANKQPVIKRMRKGEAYQSGDYIRQADGSTNILNFGGDTIVEMSSNTGVVARGVSCCGPKDNFCKATGIEIALNRAIVEFYYD